MFFRSFLAIRQKVSASVFQSWKKKSHWTTVHQVLTNHIVDVDPTANHCEDVVPHKLILHLFYRWLLLIVSDCSIFNSALSKSTRKLCLQGMISSVIIFVWILPQWFLPDREGTPGISFFVLLIVFPSESCFLLVVPTQLFLIIPWVKHSTGQWKMQGEWGREREGGRGYGDGDGERGRGGGVWRGRWNRRRRSRRDLEEEADREVGGGGRDKRRGGGVSLVPYTLQQ